MKYHLCCTAFINLGSENVTGHVLSLMLSGLHNCFCSILPQPGWNGKENNLGVKGGPQRKWLWICSRADSGNTELSHRGALIPLIPLSRAPQGVAQKGDEKRLPELDVRTPKGLNLNSGLMHSNISKGDKGLRFALETLLRVSFQRTRESCI